MKKGRVRQNRSDRAKPAWTGVVSTRDLLDAGRDPRQLHFSFYLNADPSAESTDPRKGVGSASPDRDVKNAPVVEAV